MKQTTAILALMLFAFVHLAHMTPIPIGSGFSMEDDGLGFRVQYKNSKFAFAVTCLREVEQDGTIVQVFIATVVRVLFNYTC